MKFIKTFSIFILVYFKIFLLNAQVNELDIKNQIKNALGGDTRILESKKQEKTLSQEELKTTLNDSVNTIRKNEFRKGLNIYGSELYNNPELNFLPQKNIPTPENYILGIGDEINLNIFGVQEYFSKLLINNQGNVFIDNYGPININGLTLSQAEKKIRSLLSTTIYNYLKTGGASLILTLDKIKTINVTLVGAIRSGNYNISSLSTLFHLLYLGGGPDSVGSYRNIKIIRNNSDYKKIDLYQFLKNGFSKENINLQNGDVVVIPAYTGRVKIEGEVKKNAFYELKNKEELLSDILNFTGGFTNDLLNKNIQIIRVINQKKVIQNIDSSQIHNFKLKDGDEILFKSIKKNLINYVDINGYVKNPGRYEVDKNKTIEDLITSSGGLISGAYNLKATLWRLDSNLVLNSLSIDLKDINKNNLKFPLQQYDSLYIYSYVDYNDLKYVYINGEVRKPGKYPYSNYMNLSDLLILSGDIKETGDKFEINILRKKTILNKLDKNQSYYDTFTVKIDSGFISNRINDFILKYNDIVNVKINPNLFDSKNVYIKGEVVSPGTYTLLNNNERITSIIKRAGNITAFGNIEAAKIYRKVNLEQIQSNVSEQLKEFQRFYRIDTNSIDKKFIIKEVAKFKQVVINLKDAMLDSGGENDLILDDGDSIFIPTVTNTINVEGEVFNKGLFVYKDGMSLKYYINLASGFTRNADKKRVFIILPSGAGVKTKSFLGIFNFYPKIIKGTNIYIPPKLDFKGDFISKFADKTINQPINSLISQFGNLTSTFLSFYLLKNL